MRSGARDAAREAHADMFDARASRIHEVTHACRSLLVPLGEIATLGRFERSKEAIVTDRQIIQVRGARENNLKDVSLDIPKQKITVFTGVSGSGKSSLVFDTIAAEAQRQLNETFTAFVQ